MNKSGKSKIGTILVIFIVAFLLIYYGSTKTIDAVEKQTNQTLDINQSDIGEGIAKDFISFFVGAAKGISEGISEGVNEETHENNLQASDSKNSSNMTEITNNTNITLN